MEKANPFQYDLLKKLKKIIVFKSNIPFIISYQVIDFLFDLILMILKLLIKK